MTRRTWLSLSVVALLVSGCGGAPVPVETTPRVAVPPEVTDATYDDALRAFVQLDASDPVRTALRDRLSAFLAREDAAVMAAGDYDAVVAHLQQRLSFYAPSDYAARALPGSLVPLARWLVTHGSPRGDEARVLSALLVVRAASEESDELPRAAAEAEYSEIARWTREARAHLPSPVDRFDSVVHIYEEHARLTPSEDVLQALAALYVERRDGYLRTLRSERPAAGTMTFEEFQEANQSVMRTPLDVAAVYLAVGDVARATERVDALGGASPLEGDLSEALRMVSRGGEAGAEAIESLARGFMGENIGRTDVARALCAFGLRRAPEDARFARCLARIAAIEEDFGASAGWYEEALARDPDERELYDEALEVIGELISRDATREDAADMGALAQKAERILAARAEHFPGSRPPIDADALQLAIGLAAFHAGFPDEARARYERSLAAHETAEALVELGSLELLTGAPADAATHFRRALDLTPERSRDEGEGRAQILERLGEALAAAGNTTQAARMFTQALEVWTRLRESRDADAHAQLDAHRAVLLDRLGRHPEAAIAFRASSREAAGQLAVYIESLAYLATAEQPDATLATDLYRDALRQTTMPPEWKVYLALWVRLIAARTGTAPDALVAGSLREMAHGDAWWGKLARFGTGELDGAQLVAAASGRGELAEAQFYAGAARLGAQDTPGAETAMRAVLETKMVGFFEYRIAVALLARSAPAR